MIIDYKRVKSTCLIKNDILVKMLFYVFKKHLKQKIITFHLHPLIILTFCFEKNHSIINEASR